MRVPTLKIKADTTLGYMIINESDFNGARHELLVENQKITESELETIERRIEMVPEATKREPETIERRIEMVPEATKREPETIEDERPPRRGRPPKIEREDFSD
jgi:hypothetical protein